MRNVSINTVAEHLKLKVYHFEEDYTMSVEEDLIKLYPKGDKCHVGHVQWIAEVVTYFDMILSVRATIGEGITILIH